MNHSVRTVLNSSFYYKTIESPFSPPYTFVKHPIFAFGKKLMLIKQDKINNTKQWFVLYSRPNTEKKLATYLNEIGIEAYCPTRIELRRWSDRKKKVHVPVLPSMLLVKIEERNRNDVFIRPTAIRYLYWQGKPAIVEDREVLVLRESLEKKVTLDHEVVKLKPGQEIDLATLGFEGEKGEIKYISGNNCWVIIKSLGFVLKVTLDNT